MADPDGDRPGLGADARVAARGSIASAIMQVGSRTFGVVFVLTASRVLAPAAFSRYSVVAALVVVGALFADFGTTPTIVREVSRSPGQANQVTAVAVPTSAGLGVVVYLAVVAFAWFSYSDTQAIDVTIGALAIPLGSVTTSLLAALDGVGLISRHAVISFVQATAIAVTGLAALAAGFGARGVAGSLAFAAVLTLVATVTVARRHQVWTGMTTWSPMAIRAFVRRALPFAALGLIGAVSLRFDVVLLSLLSTRRATATYDIALRAVEAVLSFNTILTGPSLYLFSSRLGRGDRDGTQRAYEEALRLAYLVGLPVSALAIVLHDPLARGLFGQSFADAAVPLAILGGHVWLALVGYVQGSLLVAGDHQHRGVVVAAAVTAVIVVLDAALIPRFGATGAAAASLATSVVTVLAFARFHRATAGLTTRLPPAGAVAATAAAAAAAWLLRDGWLPLVVTAAGAAYAVGLLATRTVTAADAARLRAILSGPPPP